MAFIHWLNDSIFCYQVIDTIARAAGTRRWVPAYASPIQRHRGLPE